MKKFLLSFLLFLIVFSTFGQNAEDFKTGSVSFISSQHIYVQFVNTDGIQIGDTLFILKANHDLQPALVVRNKSSISCIGTSLGGINLSLTNILVAKKRLEIPLEVIVEKSIESVALNDVVINKSNFKNSAKVKIQHIDGRISVSSYSNFTSNPLSISTPNYRLRYNFALNIDHIANSKFSFENYTSYTHTLNNPLENFKEINVYNLALKYDIDSISALIFGRKINTYTANIGAVDGIQYEKKLGNFNVGALVGMRPNDTTYKFDYKLFQYGTFVAHRFEKEYRTALTTLAFFNQTNSFKTDRRYLYIQHSNNLCKNVDLFCSAEIDLYAIEKNRPITDFDLTSLYLSLAYRPVSNLSLSIVYDTRKNVYYYQTYKNRIDSLLEKETRQGLRFRFNYRPFKSFIWGGNAGLRLHSPTADEALNAMSYLSYSNLPGINASIMFTGTALKTANLSGFIYGVSMSKDFLDGKLAADFEYRKALIFEQDIAELGLSWRISKSLMLSANYEITLENTTSYQRIFVNISRRF